jgi:short-subunit dehydrogenase
MAEEVEATGVSASVATVDARDAEGTAAAVAGMGLGGPIRILVYNAMLSAGSLATASIADLRAASEVNLHTPVRVAQAVLPQLVAGGGSVLLTGGGLALQPVGDLGVLSAGKAALRAAAFALAQEMEPRGVRVRTVTVAGRIRPGTPLDPDRIAEVFWEAHVGRDSAVEVVLTG